MQRTYIVPAPGCVFDIHHLISPSQPLCEVWDITHLWYCDLIYTWGKKKKYIYIYIYIYIHLVFLPGWGYWHGAPKTPGISYLIRDIRSLFFIHHKPYSITLEFKVTAVFGKSPKDKSWLPGRPGEWLEGQNFQLQSPDLLRDSQSPVANDSISGA